MAGITSAGQMLEPEEFDYSTSHRPVPIPTVGYNTTQPQRAPQIGTEPGRPSAAADAEGGAGGYASSTNSEGRRRGSFSFLRRSSSHNTTPAGAPPLPTTRIAQAHQEAAAARSGDNDSSHNRSFSSGDRSSKEGGSKMLRKQSRNKAEQERLAREALANRAPREPPRLPSQNPLPGIGQFGGDDANRPDSFAIFNNQYTTSNQAPPKPAHNFSRPGANMPSSNYQQSSSSPAYAVRSGNAFAQQAAMNSSSSPAVGGKSTNGEYVIDPTRGSSQEPESMTHRGRYSYASSTAPVNVNSPRRVRRRKDPAPFNILVIGAKNSGKTSFISFLRHSLALPGSKQPYSTDTAGDSQVNASKSSFTSHYLETEMDSERVGLTLWDSAGLEKHIIDLQLREMAAFVESKFEETFVEEQKVQRTPGVKDTHIHCVLLVLDPVRLDTTVAALSAAQRSGAGLANVGGLDDEMDLQVIRALWGKTTVIPVISKADTLTLGHMSFLKRSVWESLKGAKLDPLEALDLEGEEEEDEDALEEEDEDAEDQDGVVNNLDSATDSDSDLPKSKRNGHARNPSLAASVQAPQGDEPPYIPMSILSPDPYDLPPYTKASKTSKVGRRFPWGFADPYDAEHCDFVRLRDSIFSEWRGDLRDLARTKWYENWRTSRLKNLPGTGRQRVKGGITPTGVVPREGRSSPQTNRNFSSGNQAAAGAGAIPRSVSGSTAMTSGTAGAPIGMAVGSPTQSSMTGGLSKAERMMGIGAGDVQSVSSRGGTYRGVESYQ